MYAEAARISPLSANRPRTRIREGFDRLLMGLKVSGVSSAVPLVLPEHGSLAFSCQQQTPLNEAQAALVIAQQNGHAEHAGRG
jgi:hypothetical protein